MTNDEIKAWCKANKVTQAQLADKMGYSAGQLAQVLNNFKPMTQRMNEAILRVIKAHEEPVTVKIPDEVKAEIIKQADALRKNVDDFLHDFLAKTLGIDYPEKKTKQFSSYPIDEDDTALEACEDEKS